MDHKLLHFAKRLVLHITVFRVFFRLVFEYLWQISILMDKKGLTLFEDGMNCEFIFV